VFVWSLSKMENSSCKRHGACYMTCLILKFRMFFSHYNISWSGIVHLYNYNRDPTLNSSLWTNFRHPVCVRVNPSTCPIVSELEDNYVSLIGSGTPNFRFYTSTKCQDTVRLGFNYKSTRICLAGTSVLGL